MAQSEKEKSSLREQVALLPLAPGVYQFLDRTGTVIYVGKAKSLRKRVSSYFVQSREHSAKVKVLVRQIAEIRHIVVDSETDALLLENSLIKTNRATTSCSRTIRPTPGSWCGASTSPACSPPASCNATAPSISVPMGRWGCSTACWNSSAR